MIVIAVDMLAVDAHLCHETISTNLCHIVMFLHTTRPAKLPSNWLRQKRYNCFLQVDMVMLLVLIVENGVVKISTSKRNLLLTVTT